MNSKNSSTYTKEEWEQLIKDIYKGRCIVCLKPYVTIHEIIPKSQRPHSWRTLQNCVPICPKCHREIHSSGTKNWVKELKQLQQKRIKDFWGIGNEICG